MNFNKGVVGGKKQVNLNRNEKKLSGTFNICRQGFRPPCWNFNTFYFSYFDPFPHSVYMQSPDMAAWQNDYLQGTGCEMYTESLSHSFSGMTFAQAAE